MADSLGAVLAGINNGVGNGLDIYKTLQGEERQKREERRQSMRDTIDDQRWSLGQARQARLDERDLANDKASQEDRAMGRDLQERTLKFNQDEALRDNDAAERRHQEVMGLSRQRLNAANAKNRIDASKRLSTIYDGMNNELGAVFQGENGMRNFTELANTKPTYLAAIAHKLGGDISPDDLQGVTATMGRNKDGEVLFMLSKKDADGKDTMWDPDGDGQPGYAVSARAVSGMYGGINGIESVDTATTKVSLADEAARTAAGAKKEAPELEQRLTGLEQSRAAAEAGVKAAEAAPLGPREALEAERVALDDALASSRGGPQGRGATPLPADYAPRRAALDAALYEANGKPQNNPRGNRYTNPNEGALPPLEAEQAARAEAISTSKANLGNIVNEQGVTEQRIGQTERRAQSVQAAWGTVERAVSALPFAQQKDALLASEETFKASPQLAARHPGKDLATATDLMRKDRTAFIDKLVGATDTKTQTGLQGKREDLVGGRANLRAVLTAMGDETLMALSDHTGSLEGSLQKAAQKALEIGKPEAVPYILYADANGLDSAGTVELMQDKALMGVKDPKERFELAATAMDMVRDGGADTPISALGMVLQGR